MTSFFLHEMRGGKHESNAKKLFVLVFFVFL